MKNEIKLLNKSQTNTTSISNSFIDFYMSSASGEFVKVYLYLLRCMHGSQTELSISHIADKFQYTENDVRRALIYWEKMKLLSLEYDENKKIAGICFLDVNNESAAPEEFSGNTSFSGKRSVPATGKSDSVEHNLSKEEPLPDTSKPLTVSDGDSCLTIKEPPKKTVYTANQLDEFQKSGDIKQLLFIAEQYLGKTLTMNELSTILYFYDTLKLSADLIEYLIEYCVSKGHKSIHYIEKVALGWKEKNIETVAAAKEESTLYSKEYYSVLKAFGITGRNLVDTEASFIQKWLKEYAFSIEIILEACQRTMQQLHKPSFEYTDTILKKWNLNQVKKLSDISILDQEHKNKSNAATAKDKNPASNKFNNFQQRDYDYSKLESQLDQQLLQIRKG